MSYTISLYGLNKYLEQCSDPSFMQHVMLYCILWLCMWSGTSWHLFIKLMKEFQVSLCDLYTATFFFYLQMLANWEASSDENMHAGQ